MLTIKTIPTKVEKLNIKNIGFEYSSGNVILDKSSSYTIYDELGNSYNFEINNELYESELIILELNMYKNFEEDLNVVINGINTNLVFNLFENDTVDYTYKFYKITGFNNYCILFKNKKTTPISFKIQKNLIKKNGNCISNTNGQIVTKINSKVLDNTINAYSQLSTTNYSIVDKNNRNSKVLIPTEDLNNYTYILKGN